MGQPPPGSPYPYPHPAPQPVLPRPPLEPLDPAKKEEVAQTLLYTVGSAVLLAGIVLLVSLFLDPPPSLLVYFFGLGVAVISLIFIRLKRSSLATIIVQLVGTAVGFIGITSAWQFADVPAVMALSLATLLVGLTSFSTRLVNAPLILMWLAGITVAIDVFFPGAFTSALVGVLCLAATIGKGWPRIRFGVAAAAAVSGLQGLASNDVTWQLVWLIPTAGLSVWLVHFHRATPAAPPPAIPGRLPRAPAPPSHGQRGGQPWGVGLILLPSAWFVSLFMDVPGWTPLLVAAVLLIAGLALPEPPDAVDPQGPLRGWTTILGVDLLCLTLLMERLDSVIEPLLVLAIAIAVQFLPLVKPPLTWVSRTAPAVFALFAGRDAVFSVWGYPSQLVSDPFTIVQGVLLTILGVSLVVFRQGPPSPVLDAARTLGGLYLCVHGIVLGATLIGLQFGDGQGGFLAGHAIASLGWMSFAAWLYLSKESTINLTLALVVALGAVTKLVLYDTAALDGVARVAAFMGCGAIMVGIAFLRQRLRRRPPVGPVGPVPPRVTQASGG